MKIDKGFQEAAGRNVQAVLRPFQEDPFTGWRGFFKQTCTEWQGCTHGESSRSGLQYLQVQVLAEMRALCHCTHAVRLDTVASPGQQGSVITEPKC